MATSTTKLGLIKPDFVDVVDVSELNSNADDIDAAVGFTICTSSTRPATPWAGQPIFETDTLTPFIWSGSAWVVAGGGGSIEISATAPASPSAGDLWWDSDDGKLFIYYNDGSSSQWVDAAGPSVAVQDTAPTGYEGQLWLDSTDGSMYVYYTDPGGTASSWIGAVSRSGGILQVVSTTKTDAFSASIGSNSFSSNVTGLTATITPRSTSSKILVMTQLYGASAISNYPIVTYRIDRNGTPVGVGDLVGSRPQVTAKSWVVVNESNSQIGSSATFLDSPATTSSLTYGVQLHNHDTTTQTFYLNRSSGDTNDRLGGRPISTITLIEVAG